MNKQEDIDPDNIDLINFKWCMKFKPEWAEGWLFRRKLTNGNRRLRIVQVIRNLIAKKGGDNDSV